jgi:hypothetical protein
VRDFVFAIVCVRLRYQLEHITTELVDKWRPETQGKKTG